MVFWFSLGKSWFLVEKPTFSKKKMVLDKKTNFFPGKSWFSVEKPTFSLGKDGFEAKHQLFPRENPKNHFFGVWPYSFPKDSFFGFS